MARSFTCDGCGDPVDNPKQVGHVIQRDYCPTCAVKAEEYLQSEEAERLAVQSAFVGKRDKLIKKHGAGRFKLPDVP